MNAPIGRIISVRVIAKVTCSMLLPKFLAPDRRKKTNVRRKKSSASRVHPRKTSDESVALNAVEGFEEPDRFPHAESTKCHVERSRDISELFSEMK